MAILDINWSPTKRELRIFAMLQIVFCALVAFVIVRRHTQTLEIPLTIVSISAAIGIAGTIFTPLIRLVYRTWMAAVFPIAWVVSHAMMRVIFYLIISPMAVVMRWFRYDPMTRRFDRSAATYWIRRRRTTETSRYLKQY